MNLNLIFSIILCALLVACGGGGGDLTPTPTGVAPTMNNVTKDVISAEGSTFTMQATGSGLTYSISSAPTNGTASINSVGVVTYIANPNTSATQDTLTVTASNSAGSASAQVAFRIASDPLAKHQWHLFNTGQDAFSTTLPVAGNDMNVKGAWATGITGKGLIVNVVDSGLELAHPDLAANITTGSVNFGGGGDPTNIFSATGDHGTSVAGLIAPMAGNGLGGKGVAYGAKLMGHNYLGGPTAREYQSLTNLAKSYGGATTDRAQRADIFNASYGGTGCILGINVTENAIYSNVKTLRNGKGGLVVKSAGNGFNKDSSNTFCKPNLVSGLSNANAVFDGENTVENLIVVAAVNANGVKSSYSTTGANIWISGFGGEYGWNSSTLGFNLLSNPLNAKFAQPAMITTDQSGCSKGYHKNTLVINGSPKSANEFEREGSAIQTSLNIDCNYTSVFNGTSSAAPLVSGVIALMLEARPELTWRDVKYILAKTAKKVDSSFAPIVTNSTNTNSSTVPAVKAGITVEQAWVTNNAGFNFHNWYGFGLADAAAAVALAKTHILLAAETTKTFAASSSTVNLDALITFQVPSTTLETVKIALNLEGGNGDLAGNCFQFELTSPRGTKSILLNGGSGFFGVSQFDIEFLSNAFYGENASGTWTFVMKNICTSGTVSLVDAAPQLTIRGR